MGVTQRTTMEYQNLGKSQLRVSRLCLGTMMFADQTDLAEARRITAHAHEHGVNFIDTADVYTDGKSEAMVGELVKERRHDWVLATKLGNKMSDRPNESRYSRAWMLRECDASLQRLSTEHIDIYYLHRDYNGMDLEEPLRAIDALLRAGKIRYWGVSNFRGWRIAEVVHLARAGHAGAGRMPGVAGADQGPVGAAGRTKCGQRAAAVRARLHHRTRRHPEDGQRRRTAARSGRATLLHGLVSPALFRIPPPLPSLPSHP